MGEQRAYGHGSYADKKMRFTTIEQNLSAIRKFYDEALKDTTIANPVRNTRLDKVRAVSGSVWGGDRWHEW